MYHTILKNNNKEWHQNKIILPEIRDSIIELKAILYTSQHFIKMTTDSIWKLLKSH